MLFNAQLFFSTLAVVARLGTVGAWPSGNVSTPETVGSPSNETTPPRAINGSLGGILFCQDWDWINCTYTVQPLNTCIVMSDIWNKSISSIGPDNGTVIIAFSDTDCQGNETAIIYPGSSNLGQIGWNDIISSIKALAF